MDRLYVKKALAQSHKHLSEAIRKWFATMSVESFCREAEGRLAALEKERHQALCPRLDLARSIMGTPDP